MPQEVRQSDKKNWLVHRMQEEKQVQFVFIICTNQRLPKYIETKMLITCFLPHT